MSSRLLRHAADLEQPATKPLKQKIPIAAGRPEKSSGGRNRRLNSTIIGY